MAIHSAFARFAQHNLLHYVNFEFPYSIHAELLDL